MNIFLDATIAIPRLDFKENDYSIDCYKIRNIDSPVVQNLLYNLEEEDILKIDNLGILIVKDVSYGKGSNITIICKKLGRK